MKVEDEIQHIRRISAVVSPEELEGLLIRHVAREQHADDSDASFSGSAYVRAVDTPAGIKYEAKVEIEVDLTMLPTPA